MNRMGLGIVLLVGVAFLLGCVSRPAVPTVPPEPTDSVVIVVVTATSQPTLAITETLEPSITPIPTLTPIENATVTPTIQTATPFTPAATREATTASSPAASDVTPTSRALPAAQTGTPAASASASFPAPTVIGPEGKAYRDGDTITLAFEAVGQLAPDECYRFDITLSNPTGPGAAGDYWIGLCGNQSNRGERLSFEIRPGRFRDQANYGSLLSAADVVVPPTPQYQMVWTVTVVKVLDSTDPIHPKVQPISPTSGSLQGVFFR